jgi:hypothetical protein
MYNLGRFASKAIPRVMGHKLYLQIDVNIGSSPIASSVFGLVMGVITNVVIDFAYVLEVSFAHMSSEPHVL